MTRFRYVHIAHVVGCLLFSAAPSRAADGSGDEADARARAHFAAGVKLFDAKPPDYAGALSEFEAAMRDKPSWVIEQNIALSLRALHRYPEALDALEDALRRGGPGLKPEERAPIETAIDSLRPLIAELHVVLRPDAGPVPDGVVLLVDGVKRELSSGEARVRVGAGEHSIEALGPRLDKKDVVRVAGLDRVEVIVRLPVPTGKLVVRAAEKERVSIDGKEIGNGLVEALVVAGAHDITIARAGGGTTAGGEEAHHVFVDEGATFTFDPPGAHGNERDDDDIHGPQPGEPSDRKWNVEVGATGIYTNLRLGAPLGEAPEGTNRSLYGAAFLLRGTRKVSRFVSLGIAGDLGSLGTGDYPSPLISKATASTRVDTWAVGGVLTFATPSEVSFVSDVSLSFLEQNVTTQLGQDANGTHSRSADGIGAAFTLDAGVRYVWDRATLGAFGFATLHGVGNVTDENDAKALLDPIGFRAGARVTVGARF
jgi:hypothetical protein